MAAWNPVVPGELENGLFIGLPKFVNPLVAATKVDVKFPFAEPLIVPAICGTISKYRGLETPFVNI